MDIMETMTQLMRLQTRLSVEEKLPLAYAGIIANQALNHFDAAVRQGVIDWLEGKLTDDFSVGDFSVGKLKMAMGISDFTALCILNTLKTDPEAAEFIEWFEEKPTRL